MELRAKNSQKVGIKMENMVKCWEVMNCDKTQCPAYGVNLHCWLVEGTLCVEGQLTHKEKLQKHCFNCQVLIEDMKMSGQTGNANPQPLDIRDYALDGMSSRLSFINEHLEDEISKLLLLNKINMLLGSKHHLDERLYGILTAVTAGYGFSFNRAMLSLVNEEQNMLECVLAIAPNNQEDAHQIWTDVESKYQSLEELLMTLPKQPMMDSRVEEIIKDLKIPITREFGVLALTVIEGRPFNITDAVNDPKVNQKCREKIGTTAFATIPLWGREKVIGVIAVDNAFNNHPITDEDVAILSVFAGHAGFMIEQSKLHAKLGEQLVQLQELQERLLESERLATWGKMAGVLAHEIRNPLVPIGGFANRLYKSFPEEDKRKEEAAIIVKEVEKLEMILNNLLRSGQLPPPELQVSNINKIVRDTLLFMDNELQQKRIQTVTDLSPDLPDVMVDDCQMQQVFLNLFQNSVRAMADGGELQIGTANDDKFVLIDVTDTGMGISKDVMKRIFDPFFTTNEQGFGIGLSVVKQIVEAHNGAIDVKSQLNVGTTFSISLPILAEKIS